MSKRLGALRLSGAILCLAGVFWSVTVQAGTVLHHVGSVVPQGGGQPFDLALSDDGAFLYVSDSSAARVHVLARDAQSGGLTLLQTASAAAVPCSAMRIGSSPDQKNLYLACPYSPGQQQTPIGQLANFARDLQTGLLTYRSTVASQPYPQRVVVSPDGSHVYALGTDGGSATLMAYARDQGTGDLTMILPGQNTPRDQNDMAFANDQKAYLGGGGRDVSFHPLKVVPYGTLSTVIRSALTGALSGAGFTRVPQSTGEVNALAFEPGSQALHLVGGGFLTGYSVGPSFTLLYTIGEGRRGVSGLAGALDLAVSPGAVYVAATADDGTGTGQVIGLLLAFRHLPSGAARYVETVADLATANAVVVAPGAADVYVAAPSSSTVEIFRDEPVCPPQPRNDCRAATRGMLTFKRSASGGSLRFLWQNDLTSFPLAGDPWGGSTYSLCLYDAPPSGAALVASIDAPQGRLTAGRGWKRYAEGAAVSRFKYRDPFLTPDGVAGMDLEKQRVRMRAKGLNLVLPSLPFDLPLTAQVGTDFGECWEVRFDAPEVRLSDPVAGRFTARFDAN